MRSLIGRTGLSLPGVNKVLPYSWLLDMCTCPKCIDATSKQKLSSSGSKHHTRPPISAKLNESDKVLSVQWDADGQHCSSWSVAQLKSLATTPAATASDGVVVHESPKVLWMEFADLQRNVRPLLDALHSNGLCFVKNVPIEVKSQDQGAKESTSSVPGVIGLAQLVGPIMDTFYGRHWDVKFVKNAENIAYTNMPLDWHQDLMYFDSPPGVQFLHCLTPADSGGETCFLDGVNIGEAFKQKHPKYHSLLSSVDIPYQYVAMGLSLNHSRPVFVPSKNNYSRSKIFWSPQWQAPLPCDAQLYEALHSFEEFLKDWPHHVDVRLEKGDAVVFDNHRMLHARKVFKGGLRHLQGCYVSIDSYLTSYRNTKM